MSLSRSSNVPVSYLIVPSPRWDSTEVPESIRGEVLRLRSGTNPAVAVRERIRRLQCRNASGDCSAGTHPAVAVPERIRRLRSYVHANRSASILAEQRNHLTVKFVGGIVRRAVASVFSTRAF
jgi:hypothetical protein